MTKQVFLSNSAGPRSPNDELQSVMSNVPTGTISLEYVPQRVNRAELVPCEGMVTEEQEVQFENGPGTALDEETIQRVNSVEHVPYQEMATNEQEVVFTNVQESILDEVTIQSKYFLQLFLTILVENNVSLRFLAKIILTKLFHSFFLNCRRP